MSKYNSSKVEAYGRTWDSKTELQYYEYLLKLQESGEVLKIEIQPSLILQEKFVKNGIKYRAITYTPDFLVEYADGSKAYIDVKGMSTPASELRRKLFAAKYDTPLLWISQSMKWSSNACILYDELHKIRRNNRKAKEE